MNIAGHLEREISRFCQNQAINEHGLGCLKELAKSALPFLFSASFDQRQEFWASSLAILNNPADWRRLEVHHHDSKPERIEGDQD